MKARITLVVAVVALIAGLAGYTNPDAFLQTLVAQVQAAPAQEPASQPEPLPVEQEPEPAESPEDTVPVEPAQEPEPAEDVEPEPEVQEPEPAEDVEPEPEVQEPEPAEDVEPEPEVQEPAPVEQVEPDPAPQPAPEVVEEPEPEPEMTLADFWSVLQAAITAEAAHRVTVGATNDGLEAARQALIEAETAHADAMHDQGEHRAGIRAAAQDFVDFLTASYLQPQE
ncbi:MAG: hypothetical protein OXG72_04840 [Acidobacteria bacterium]|nr:hypothetical protein [Acidobacteriota bacterium]